MTNYPDEYELRNEKNIYKDFYILYNRYFKIDFKQLIGEIYLKVFTRKEINGVFIVKKNIL